MTWFGKVFLVILTMNARSRTGKSLCSIHCMVAYIHFCCIHFELYNKILPTEFLFYTSNACDSRLNIHFTCTCILAVYKNCHYGWSHSVWAYARITIIVCNMYSIQSTSPNSTLVNPVEFQEVIKLRFHTW